MGHLPAARAAASHRTRLRGGPLWHNPAATAPTPLSQGPSKGGEESDMAPAPPPQLTEFYVMPLSRYWADDYIHPVMELAWAQDRPCQAIDPATGELRTLPRNTPLGGPEASKNRERDLPETRRKLAGLPGANDGVWDEASVTEPRFHHTPAQAFAALVREAEAHSRRVPLHLARANIFLPVTFEEPQKLGKDVFGSVFRLQTELRQLPWSPQAQHAATAMLEAAQDASMLLLPLIIARQ
jgi:hypothetical protein